MSMPLVSVAVPCYNQAVFLFESINSLLRQGEKRWEAVVVDDGSCECDAESIVASYRDARLHHIRQDVNRGIAATRNTAFRGTTAPYLLTLDADDFLHPDYLKTMLHALCDGYDCVFSDFQLVGLSQDVWPNCVKTADAMAESQWIPGSGILMRRSVWESVGGYCEADALRPGNEDWDFWIGALEQGVRPRHVPEVLYYYRRHSHSLMSTLGLADCKTRECIVERHPSFFSVGARRNVFLAQGLANSARADFQAGNHLAAAGLGLRAIACRPGLAWQGCRRFASRMARIPVRLGRRALLAARSVGNGSRERLDSAVTDSSGGPGIDWEGFALVIHKRYGHLSHDYGVLEEILRSTAAGSVLEIGCGSGRLFPVYLKQNLHTILAQDVSQHALDLCRERFRYQSQIHYFCGRIEMMPLDRSLDLIVSTRVLRHLLDDADVWRALQHLAPHTRAFFLNEAPLEAGIARLVVGRDYTPMFARLGFECARSGTVEAENGALRQWRLFSKR